jgi:hypothetical protein
MLDELSTDMYLATLWCAKHLIGFDRAPELSDLRLESWATTQRVSLSTDRSVRDKLHSLCTP